MLLSKIWLIPKIIVILLVSATSPWFLPQPILYKAIILITTLTLLLYVNFKKSIIKVIFFVFYIALIFAQVFSTDIKNTYNFSDHRKYLHQNRLDQYPPSLARVGNIIENHLDSPIIYQTQQNFFESLDLVNYFKNFFPIVYIFPFIFGLYKFLKHPNGLLTITTIFSVLLLSVVGIHGSYGPIIIFPIIAIIISHYPFEK